MKPLNFPAQIDYYLDAVSCRNSLIESLKPIIEPYKNGSILDCSVGTGFGVIELINSGYNIICSDACGNMLNRFTKNSQSMNVTSSPLKIKWQELGCKLPELFDLVLCRGNSIIYSDMWDNTKADDDINEIITSLEGIYSSIKDGGCLYVDIPSDKFFNFEAPMVLNHNEKQVNCLPVCVDEKITHNKETNKRKWEVEMTIAGDKYSFTKYSHLILEQDFKNILIDIGFKKIEKIEGCKFREHYCEFIAHK
ncbi:hypothetical protein AHAT_37530 [Agarivorans sp. Toyoura001]|uniref:hypothetical protein n=1 Tax=Agarivorans sp. Toyoura001 TaxID=2283141 RepID=UPI0010D266F8|nr:hypothetical protein [Agarivorans sp. Toyoura001]GDY27863.1 hypothetical protein AHAT_37530 [Agarivorans sp. Toyoura001]